VQGVAIDVPELFEIAQFEDATLGLIVIAIGKYRTMRPLAGIVF